MLKQCNHKMICQCSILKQLHLLANEQQADCVLGSANVSMLSQVSTFLQFFIAAREPFCTLSIQNLLANYVKPLWKGKRIEFESFHSSQLFHDAIQPLSSVDTKLLTDPLGRHHTHKTHTHTHTHTNQLEATTRFRSLAQHTLLLTNRTPTGHRTPTLYIKLSSSAKHQKD